jgi:PPOX class probable F420-dependent enzyme
MFTLSLVEKIIDQMPVARLAQLDDEGAVQVLPFVCARVGNTFWSPIDGKPKKHAGLRRLEWIAEHPQVCVLFDHYADDWSQLWWLKLFCNAASYQGDHEDWDKAIQAVTGKYPQYTETPLFLGPPTMIRFDVTGWKSWSAGSEAAVEALLHSTRAGVVGH